MFSTKNTSLQDLINRSFEGTCPYDRLGSAASQFLAEANSRSIVLSDIRFQLNVINRQAIAFATVTAVSEIVEILKRACCQKSYWLVTWKEMCTILVLSLKVSDFTPRQPIKLDEDAGD